jgi:hypothetical protein
MTQLSKTFERPSSLLPAAAAGLLVAGAIAIGAFAVGFGVGTQAGVTDAAAAPDVVVPAPAAVAPAPVAVRTDRAAILSRLDSEYLRQIAAGWYVTGSRSAIDPNQFQSEYLREISAGW